MVRTTLGAEVETSVTVSGSESVDFISRIERDTVTSGSIETVSIRPPQGVIYELSSLTLFTRDVQGSTSGTHEFLVTSETNNIGVLLGRSSNDDKIAYIQSHIETATVDKRPPTPVAQNQAIKGLRIDNQNGILLRYLNKTDADKSQQRQYKLWVRAIRTESV